MEVLNDAPKALDLLVSELKHTGRVQYVGAMFAVPTRLQAHLYGMVEALTNHTGTSRNKVMNQLVEIGIQATLDALPEELVNQLHERSGEALRAGLEKNGELMEAGEV